MLPTCRIFRNGGRGTPFSRSSRSGGLWRWPKSPKLCSLFPGNLKIFMCFRFLRKKNCMLRQGGGAASCKQDCVWKNCACVLCTGDHLLSEPIFLVFWNGKFPNYPCGIRTRIFSDGASLLQRKTILK